MNCAVHAQTQAVAFCRTCGKALCEDCKRDVMGAIYCEPCIAARLQGSGVPGVPSGVPVAARIPGSPNPSMAGLLGFIPGVGAMYNGQFAKAFAHVVIFVLLIIGCNISGLFGLGIAFFEFYMAFEAYKTAEAKRLGLPAPDPLGLDKMFGIQDSQPPAATVIAVPTPTPLHVEPPPPPQARDNTPMGAIVLIILGLVFLLDNLGLLRIHQFWPLLFIGMGLWIAYKRINRQAPGGTQQ